MAGNGIGSIQSRKNNNGKTVYDVRYRYYSIEKGEMVATTKRGFTRKKDAQEFLDGVSERIRGKKYVEKSNKTIEFIADEWFNAEVNGRLAANTVNWYKVNKDNHIIPHIGKIAIQDLTIDVLQDLYDMKMESGLSSTTVYYIHRTMKKIYGYAMRKRYVENDLTKHSDLQVYTPSKNNIEVIDMRQVQAMIFDSNMDREMIVPIALAGMMGLRRGEVLGLRWKNILWDRKVLRVQEQRTSHSENTVRLKTRSSERELPIPDIVMKLLVEHKAYISELAPKYNVDVDFEQGFVCCYLSPEFLGSPFQPSYFSKKFSDSLEFCGYRHMRFHDLRHTYASYLLHEKVPPTTVAALMGHASPDITLKIYAHISKTAYIQEFKEINKNLSKISEQFSETCEKSE